MLKYSIQLIYFMQIPQGIMIYCIVLNYTKITQQSSTRSVDTVIIFQVTEIRMMAKKFIVKDESEK